MTPVLPAAILGNHLLQALNTQQLETVVSHCKQIKLAEKQLLFNRGDAASSFYIVNQGQIKLYRLSPDGSEKVFDIVQSGQAFAEAVMFMQEHQYPVSAESLTASDVYAFNMNTFLGILQHSSEVCLRIMAILSQRLHMRLNEIDTLSMKNGSFRLVYYLLQQIPQGAVGTSRIHLNIPKNVIASRLSIQPETLSRLLADLKHLRLIEVHRQDITLLDIPGLRQFLQQ
jgi:CRP-like cAMP-binding protein